MSGQRSASDSCMSFGSVVGGMVRLGRSGKGLLDGTLRATGHRGPGIERPAEEVGLPLAKATMVEGGEGTGEKPWSEPPQEGTGDNPCLI